MESTMSKDPQLQTISVNLPRALVKRVQALGFNHDLSVSSIAEQSLEAFLEDLSEEENAERLRVLGASLRRVAS
jgi:predicted transcriptional regulator